MSEADNTWRVTVDGREREIEVTHSTMTGKVVVSVDGVPTRTGRLILLRQELPVPLGEHQGQVSVAFAYAGFGARSALHVDGRYVEPLRR
ncbi:hypothetical protein [Kineosporia sp. R_H_3]|uniref:hypothetical protein n=1 Tax=Kineosporia sp. R_H_3 TaxID=1961848 RepID=UPI000B4ADDC5|nr:hypothetical protein [Kineosporia sp. R_H_3]